MTPEPHWEESSRSKLLWIINLTLLGIASLFSLTLVVYISKQMSHNSPYKRFVRWPVLLCIYFHSLATLASYISEFLWLFDTKYFRENNINQYCIVTEYSVVFLTIARLALYYFWLGRLDTIFKKTNWKIPKKHLKRYAFFMFITVFTSQIIYWTVRELQRCKIGGLFFRF